MRGKIECVYCRSIQALVERQRYKKYNIGLLAGFGRKANEGADNIYICISALVEMWISAEVDRFYRHW
jgi:hypothetical protein